MPITKGGAELIKYAMPRWREVFQSLGNISQHAIQQGKRPWAKPPQRNLSESLAARLDELRKKYGPKNGIGVTSDTFKKPPVPLKLIKSDRRMLLGNMLGNKRKRELLGYYQANVSGMSQDEINKHMSNLFNSAQAHQGAADKWKRTNPQRARLEEAKAQRDITSWNELMNGFDGKRMDATSPADSWYNVGSDHYHKILFTQKYELPGDLGVKIPSGVMKGKNRRLMEALSEQHELDEAIANENAILRHIIRDSPPTFDIGTLVHGSKKYIRNPGRIESTKFKKSNGKPVCYGNHASIDVLVKERRMLDTFTNIRNPAYKLIRNVRNQGEQQFLDAVVGYDPAKSVLPGQRIKTFHDYRKAFRKPLLEKPFDIKVGVKEDTLKLAGPEKDEI